ncbi:afadin- and alpha-actinin-binding protein-like [Bombina bombina]|uniref:afadin- and alpha-actinin-binding protein-like n=1 Tax=Bombina bombina TaxID=8345 RepID=UPI00235ADA6D|nr:afadin- and alpha-actinin-binding protein-like [Bombina bombina]
MYRSSGTQDRQFRELGENSELKKFHEYLKKEVQVILNRHGIAPSRETVEDPPGIGKRGGRMKTSRGADTGFINSLKKQWSTLKQLVESLEVQASQANAGHVISVTDHEKELTRLREEIITLKEELQMSKELISQQQQLLQDQLLPKPGESVSSPLWDAYFLEEQLRLEQDREAFEEQKLAFQDEREKFTEAAIRLGRERLQFKSDQALFIKQQFLNMTPGLGTPPWKNTPPWSALTPDSVKRSPRHPKVSFTPYGTNKSQSKVGTTLDPATPSTAELYRVLRLAPPSRCTAESQRPVRSIKREEIKPERAQRWSDSLSSMSESSEPEALPQSMLPLKSMTPYLRPRQTPLSLPRNAYDSLTPSTANLFRMRKLTPSTRRGLELVLKMIAPSLEMKKEKPWKTKNIQSVRREHVVEKALKSLNRTPYVKRPLSMSGILNTIRKYLLL